MKKQFMTREQAKIFVANVCKETMTKSNAKAWTPVMQAIVDKIVNGTCGEYVDQLMHIERTFGGVLVSEGYSL